MRRRELQILFFLRRFSLVFLVTELLAWRAGHAADQDFFDIYGIEVEGKIHNFVVGDFDGDSLRDVVVIYSPQSGVENRYLGLHLQRRDGSFGAKADFLTELPKSAAQIDVADYDGDSRQNILAADADGVIAFSFSSGNGWSAPQRLIRQSTLYAFPMFEGIIVSPFVVDLLQKPGLEMVIPTAKGYAIFEKNDRGAYQILNQLSTPIVSRHHARDTKDLNRYGNTGFSISLAQIYIFDGNLDGRADLYFLWDRKLCTYFQDNSGNFPQTPDVELDFYPGNSDGYLQSYLLDMNGDRRPDLAVSHTSGGITKTETKLRFYIADAHGRMEKLHRREISLSDSHCNLMFGDFRSNGRYDMVISAIEIGAIAATKMLLMKKADLHLLIYPLTNGLPENESTRRMSFEFKFNFDHDIPTEEVCVNWSADFNADRLLDLVFCDGGGKVQFYWGKERDYLSRKPDIDISLDHPSMIYPLNLGRGNYPDVVLRHNLGGRLDRLTILKNRNNRSN